jgi:cyclophilin family peptidyl-prolyl cis-trans isomerase
MISAAQANTDAAATKSETKTETKTEKKTEKKDNAAKDIAKVGAKKMTTVVIETSLGNIEIELNAEKAPISTENFLKYVDKKHYDGTIFHRVISNFMIQGGGMTEKMDEKKSDAPIKNEAANGLKNDRGTLAMARTSVVDSATAQFFINVQDNDFLNHKAPNPRDFGYAVFGKVTSGMDVVDKIKAVPTGMTGGMQDVPKTPVVMKSVRRK